MRWRFTVGIALLVGTLGTGCPEHVYGRGGSLDDAMLEDMEEQQDERQRELGTPVPCRDGSSPRRICEDPKQPETCHWDCR
jgi:hypothetical protein